MKIEQLFIYCLLAGTSLLASCSNEEMIDNQDKLLPSGKYPLTFTTSVRTSGVVTRVSELPSGESKWDGNETVKVRIGTEIKDYTMTASGELRSQQPFYWNSTAETKQVTAWYPSTLTFNGQVKDQSSSEKYMGCDVLKTDQTSISYMDPSKELTFKHQMAKVIIHLLQNDGTTPMTDATSVEILCVNNFTYNEGSFTNSSNTFDYVSPFRQTNNSDYKAMIVPQDMTNQQFIKVVYGGNTYYWTPGSGEANLNPGNTYTYKITVMSAYLDVEVVKTTSNDISWGQQEDSTEAGTVN
ncbi:fimbrillin family protein [Parabacteroides merdae]|uniref:Fimbrillin family protein n=1 Tax=Parabacteroides merdae TaxID=46503 RepID=A0A3R6LD20_9BACT|nr:fimbrillin family protein [Parabacteroides merdae]RHH80286.1 fimbrillin family protein [Parabacteroides merdae]